MAYFSGLCAKERFLKEGNQFSLSFQLSGEAEKAVIQKFNQKIPAPADASILALSNPAFRPPAASSVVSLTPFGDYFSLLAAIHLTYAP
ncbi:MAG: hypothetical protein ABIQ93_06035 [Saprospiraceae bacterium]